MLFSFCDELLAGACSFSNSDERLKRSLFVVPYRRLMKREPKIELPIKKPAKVDQPGPRWPTGLLYFLLAMLVLWGWQDLFYQMSVRTIPYSEFKKFLARHEVVAAVVKQDEIDGRIVPKNETTPPNATASLPNENKPAEPS